MGKPNPCPIYPRGETGIHDRLKTCCLGVWVRLPPGIQNSNIKVTLTNRPSVAHVKLYQSKVEVIDHHMFDIYI